VQVRVEGVGSGKDLKKVVQLQSFLRGQGGQQLRFVLFGHAAQPAQVFLAPGREPELIVPAVRVAPAPFHQPASFKGIDEGHDPAGDGSEPVGQLALAQGGGPAQEAKNAGVPWSQSEGAGMFRESLRGQRADLGEQE
jgi:hypothetical protein